MRPVMTDQPYPTSLMPQETNGPVTYRPVPRFLLRTSNVSGVSHLNSTAPPCCMDPKALPYPNPSAHPPQQLPHLEPPYILVLVTSFAAVAFTFTVIVTTITA
ncbi:hypothetical protein Vafri_5095, partial [Volvox africanus]